MSLAQIFTSLKADVLRNLPRNTESFAEARARRPEIAPYSTVGALLDALAPSSPLPIKTRRALIAALVREAQTARPSFASAVLTLALAPMLHRLRKRSGTAQADPDLDSTILLAFTTAIRVVPPSPYSVLALRWATQRTVFAACRASRGFVVTKPFDEDLHGAPGYRDDAREILIDVLRSLERSGGAESLDAFLMARDEDESLGEFVKRTCADVNERQTHYERIYGARRNFERALRKRLMRRAARPVRPHDYRAVSQHETRNERIRP